MVVVIFGVAGVGKTTVGKLLAEEMRWKFYDADDFHSASNVEKMRRGVPLTDEDRQPWLQTLRELVERSLAENENSVVACSALKKKYRDQLRAGQDVRFIYLRGDRSRIEQQLKNRRGHYFDAKLLGAQFADLEEPKSTDDAVTVELEGEARDVVNKLILRARLR